MAPRPLALLLLASATLLAAGEPEDTAYRLALQVTEELRPPRPLVAKVARMLAQARRAAPEVASTGADPNAGAASVIVTLDEGVKKAVLEPLHERLGVTRTDSFQFMNGHTLWFREPLNFQVVERLLRELPGVKSVSPNSVIGSTGGATLAREGEGFLLTVHQGSGDCFAGCIENSYWDFHFDAAGALTGGGPRPPGKDHGPPRPGTGVGLGLGIGGPGLPGPAGPGASIEFPAPGRPRR